MKKIFLLAAFAVLGTSSYTSQEISYGAKAGVNFSNFVGDVSNNETLTGFYGGLYANFALGESLFSIQPEVLYSTQGADFNGGSALKLDYLNIPIMARYEIAEKFNLEFGPQLGILLSADSGGVDFKNSMKSIDIGLNIGAGYELDNGLNFGVRYNVGMTDVLDITGFSGEYKNAVISAGLGYTFK